MLRVVMPQDVFLLPPFFDYAATLLWAISGALVGARRGYDVIGVFILAFVSAAGGGLLRDGLFLQDGTPLLLRSPVYLSLIAGATAVVMTFGKRVPSLPGFQRIVDVVDAMGLGAYAVVGMNLSLVKGLNPPAAMLVGMVNATGGAILRSVISGREPHLFRPGKLEAVAALLGCGLFTIVAVFVIRLWSVAFGVSTRPVPSFEEDWRDGRGRD
jgi:uncharacterized membrane protein YeiH